MQALFWLSACQKAHSAAQEGAPKGFLRVLQWPALSGHSPRVRLASAPGSLRIRPGFASHPPRVRFTSAPGSFRGRPGFASYLPRVRFEVGPGCPRTRGGWVWGLGLGGGAGASRARARVPIFIMRQGRSLCCGGAEEGISSGAMWRVWAFWRVACESV